MVSTVAFGAEMSRAASCSCYLHCCLTALTLVLGLALYHHPHIVRCTALASATECQSVLCVHNLADLQGSM